MRGSIFVPLATFILAVALSILVRPGGVLALRMAQSNTGDDECCHVASISRGANVFVNVVGRDSDGDVSWVVTVIGNSNGTIQVEANVTDGAINLPLLRNSCTMRFDKQASRECRHFAELSKESEILSSFAYTYPRTLGAGPIKVNSARIQLDCKTTSSLQSDIGGDIDKKAHAKANVHNNAKTGLALSLPKGGGSVPFDLAEGKSDTDFEDSNLREAGKEFNAFCEAFLRGQVNMLVRSDSTLFVGALTARANALVEGPFMTDQQEPIHVGFATDGGNRARDEIIIKFDCSSPERKILPLRDANVEGIIERLIRRGSETD